jgi:hypothetical protein
MKEKENIEKKQDEALGVKPRSYSFFFKILTLIFIIFSIVIVNNEYLIPLRHTYFNDDKTGTDESYKIDDHDVNAKAGKEIEFDDSIEAEVEKEKLETLASRDAERYRLYLVNVARLISKFYANIDYDKEQSYLSSSHLEYPKKVTIALTELKQYREKYLTHKSEQYQKIILEGNFIKRLANKMINIRQENPVYQSMEEAKKILQNELGIIEDYFYSQEFLKYCLNYD